MAITPVKTLVAQAKEQIQTLLQEDAEAQVAAGTAQFIDIRDIRELKREGSIPGALHAPRGMLEFWMDPNSSYFKEGKVDMDKEIVLFCAGGLRSALGAKSLKDMGFEKVSHVDGGFGAMKTKGFKIT